MTSQTKCKTVVALSIFSSRGNDVDYKKFLAETMYQKNSQDTTYQTQKNNADPFIDKIKFIDGVSEAASKDIRPMILHTGKQQNMSLLVAKQTAIKSNFEEEEESDEY